MSLHKETMFLFVVFSFSIMLAVVQTKPIVDSSYVAAVYEHNLILNPEPNVTRSRLAALQHMQKNLDIYEEQAARAAQQVWSEQGRVLNVCLFNQRNRVAH